MIFRTNNILPRLIRPFAWLIYCLCCTPAFAGTPCPLDNTAITLTVNHIYQPTCGQANGRIIVIAAAGTAPYSYTINGGPSQPGGNFLSLAPSDYLIEVTDAIGAVASTNVILVNLFSPPSASITPLTAAGCSDYGGSITIDGSGGTAPYMYSMDLINFQSSNSFSNLTAGEYHYFVRDANGCLSSYSQISNSIGMVGTCAMYENGIGFSYTCFPYIGKITFINIDGGTPPYQFSMDAVNYQNSSQFTNLEPGIKKVWVKDAAGLIFLHSTTLIDWCLSPILISATVQHANCGLNGIITVTANGGASPYEYSIDGIQFQNSNQFTGLTPGNYTITVRDMDSLVSKKFVIVRNSCLTVTANAVNSTCSNNNGKIDIHAVDGIAPYLYSIDGINFIAGNIFTNLNAGNYTAYVKDFAGEIKSTLVIVDNSPGPQIISATSTPADCIANTGSITINAQGGTGPLFYSIDGLAFQNNALFTAIAPGSYTAISKDANGCTNTYPVTVALNNIITLEAGNDEGICEGKTASLNAISNASQFSWTPTAGLSNPASAQTLALPAATTKYYLTAMHGLCSKIDSVTISVKPNPVPSAGEDKIICFGKNVMLHGTGGSSYSWHPATYLNNSNIADPTITNPAIGSITYSLTVIGSNGCSSVQDAVVTIQVTPDAKVFAGNDTSILVNTSVTLNASDVNQSGFNQYHWSPVQGLNNPSVKNPVALITSDITYMVEAITPGGCMATDKIEIKVFDHAEIYVPTAFTPNGDNSNDVLKAIPVGIKHFQYFIIYDRYGNKIFNTTNAQKGWDGKIKNEAANVGTFVWIAAGIDHQNRLLQRKGTVLLLR